MWNNVRRKERLVLPWKEFHCDFVTGPIYQEICIEAGSFDVIPSKDGSDEGSQAEAGTQSSCRGKLRLCWPASPPQAPCRYTREEAGVSRQFGHSPAGAEATVSQLV
ncbi:unnamed protein product [Arctogadus glacialis]